VVRQIEKIVQPGPEVVTAVGPLTSRSKKVIEFSIHQATRLDQSQVGTGHLLLGLLEEQEGVAAQVLNNFGMTLAPAVQEVKRIYRQGVPMRRDSEREENIEQPEPVKVVEPAPQSRNVPTPVLEVLKALDDKISELNALKETAVAETDFEKAAHLRDKADRLIKDWIRAMDELKKLV